MQPKTAACFSTFAEAMYVGSGGALRLPADAHVLPHGPDALIPFGPDVWLLDRE